MSETKKYICDCGEVYSSLAAIESCQSHHNHNEPDLAAINAELVAALEGLTAVLGRHEEPCGCDFCQALDNADAILARAKGEK